MTDRERFRESFARLQAPPELLSTILEKTEGSKSRRFQTRAALRRLTALAVAAALLLALGVSAWAVGRSIHARRQQELRESLGVRDAPAYVEYETGAAETGSDSAAASITLLSALRQGEYQRVFLNVGPVAEEEIVYGSFDKGELHPVFSLDGGLSWTPAVYHMSGRAFADEDMEEWTDYFGQTVRVPRAEAVTRRIREESYDAQSRTVTIVCGFYTEGMEESVEIRVALTDDVPALEGRDAAGAERSLLRDFGSLRFTLTRPDCRLLLFPESLSVTWEETGTEYRVLGVELDSGGTELLLDCPDIGALFDTPEGESEAAFHARFEAQLRWSAFIDELLKSTVLTLSDGTEIPLRGGADFTRGEGSSIRLYSAYPGQIIDVSQVETVSIRGVRQSLN